MIRSARLMLAFGLTLTAAQDLGVVKSEPNPEKRSEKALALADRQMEAAGKAYNAGETESSFNEAEGMLTTLEFAVKSLEESGKGAHGSKYYKRAELKTRDLGRRLSDFSQSVSYEDRPRFHKVRDRILAIHDQLLDRILARTKK